MVLFFLDVVQYALKNFDVQMYFIQHSSAQHGCIRASVFLSVTKEKELKEIFLKEFSRFLKLILFLSVFYFSLMQFHMNLNVHQHSDQLHGCTRCVAVSDKRERALKGISVKELSSFQD